MPKETKVQTFVDPAQTIHVSVGETFVVALAGNPTTGYLWEASVDDQYLELLFQDFEPEGESVGAGGWELFHFCALDTGRAQIDFVHKRPWEAQARDTRHFRVEIA
jgi:predicted secreted protein